MIVFGIVLTTLGASLPSLVVRFGIDMRDAGALLSLLSLGVLGGSLVFGPIVDRRGYRGMLVVAFAAIGCGLEAIAFAPSIAWLRGGLLLTGFFGGMVNGAANGLVADVSGEQRTGALALVGGFFGIGAAGVPFVLASLAGRFSQPAILAVCGSVAVVPLTLTALASLPAPKQPHGVSLRETRALLSDRALLLMGFMLFLESGIESILGGFTPTLFAELRVAAERAPIYLALFWLGLMVTRLTLGFALTPAARQRGLAVALGTALVVSLWLVSTQGVAAAAICVFLLGCAFAPVFPVILAFVVDRYTLLSGTALSIVFTMALTGGMLMPYATGVLAEARGLRMAFVLVPAALIVMLVLRAALARYIWYGPAVAG